MRLSDATGVVTSFQFGVWTSSMVEHIWLVVSYNVISRCVHACFFGDTRGSRFKTGDHLHCIVYL